MSRKRAMSKGRAIYRWILFAAVLAAVTWFAARNIGEMRRYDFDFDRTLVALSFLSVVAAYLVRFGAWIGLSATLGLRAPVLRAARAYFLSTLSRYVPGKVGLALVRVEAYRGNPARLVVLATGLELICAMAAALLLAIVGLALSPAPIPSYLRWLPLVCIVPLIVALHPGILKRAGSAVLRLVGLEPLERVPSFASNGRFVLLYTLPGLLHGLGLFLLLASIGPVPAGHYPAITGAYYLANIAGLAAVFAPGGLGVREGILFLVLPLLVGRQSAIVAAVAIRLVTFAAEVVLAAAASVRIGGAGKTTRVS